MPGPADDHDVALLRARLAAQLLAGRPAGSPVVVVERILAVQAQDLQGARLAIRVRSSGVGVGDIDRALSDDRSLLITWLNRGTLHLVRRQDYPWLQALTTPPILTTNARRLAQEGVSPDAAERGVATVTRALTAEGPLLRGELRDRLSTAGVPTAGQALVHILMLASLRGLIVRGPVRSGQQAFVLVRDWLGPQEPVRRELARAELARRYLEGHAPATELDLARWSGLPIRDARAGLAAVGRQLVERSDGRLELRGQVPPPDLPRPRLLGQYDPVLLGWVSREQIVGAHPQIVTVNGLFRPFALVGGRAVATWKIAGRRVVITPFAELPGATAAALDADAAEVARFYGWS